MADVVRAIRTAAGWTANQSAMEALYGAGNYFTSISSWLSWCATNYPNLVSSDVRLIAVCYDDWASGLADSVDISSSTFTVGANNYFVIEVADGEGHGGVPGGGFYISDSLGYDDLVKSTCSYTVFDGLEVINTNSTGKGIFVPTSGVGKNLIAKAGGGGIRVASGGKLQSSFAIDCNNTNTYGIRGIGVSYIYNCAAINCYYGFWGEDFSNRPVVKNSFTYQCTDHYYKNFNTSCSNNASSDYSGHPPPGTSPYTSNVVSGDFADAANDDFHLSASSGLIGQGVNLYSDFTTDIDGDTWPSSAAWDIGADYYTSGGAGASISGAVTAEAATASGTVTATYAATVSGAVTAAEATVSGAATAEYSATVTGTATAETASASGAATAHYSADVTGGATAEAATAVGTATAHYSADVTGGATAEAATASGNIVGAPITVVTGAVTAEVATSAGTATIDGNATVSGAASALAATASGTATAKYAAAATGAASALAATGSGAITSFSHLVASGSITAPEATATGTVGTGISAIVSGAATAPAAEATGTLALYTPGAGLTYEQDLMLRRLYAAHFNRRTRDPGSGVITIFEVDGVTPMFQFDSNSDLSEITPKEGT